MIALRSVESCNCTISCYSAKIVIVDFEVIKSRNRTISSDCDIGGNSRLLGY